MSGVAAHRDGCGSRMVGVADNGHPLPGDALQVFHGADLNAFALENRTLFDMQLDVGMWPDDAWLMLSIVADAPQLLTKFRAICSHSCESGVDIEAARIDERSHHVGGVAHTFLIGEGGDHDRTRRLEPRCDKRLDDFKARQNAITSVINARVDHGIDVRSEHERCFGGNGCGPPDAEYVADTGRRQLPSRPAQSTRRTLSRPSFLRIRSRETGQPTVVVTTDFAELKDPAEQPFGVDGNLAHHTTFSLTRLWPEFFAAMSAGVAPTNFS